VATQHAVDEADIRQQLDKLIEAIRAMDLEGLKPIYASDIVSFDVGPPLQRLGVEGKCLNWDEAFTVFQPPIGFEIRDLTITSGGDVAFGHGFNRLSGTEKREYEQRCLGSRDLLLSEDRRRVAHRARPRIGASRFRERQSGTESRTLTVWRSWVRPATPSKPSPHNVPHLGLRSKRSIILRDPHNEQS
jgi:ketosteroid isomerase-like protein